MVTLNCLFARNLARLFLNQLSRRVSSRPTHRPFWEESWLHSPHPQATCSSSHQRPWSDPIWSLLGSFHKYAILLPYIQTLSVQLTPATPLDPSIMMPAAPHAALYPENLNYSQERSRSKRTMSSPIKLSSAEQKQHFNPTGQLLTSCPRWSHLRDGW